VPENTERSLLGGSGRRQAWGGAVRLAAERPALGYAFGLEDHVFVDRYLQHGSNLPENSYVGLFLQLGVTGVALFVALVGALLAAGARAVRASTPRARRLAAAGAGGFVAGLALALTQSFIYAAGSNATMAVWLCAFLLPAAAAARDASVA
jgi:O-antigen ligase